MVFLESVVSMGYIQSARKVHQKPQHEGPSRCPGQISTPSAQMQGLVNALQDNVGA